MRRFRIAAYCPVVCAAGVFTGAGCSTPSVIEHVERGEYGIGREVLLKNLTNDKSERSYFLDRMQLCLVDLADGVPRSAERTVDESYEILRTQGINADKTVASVVINESVKFWKGEPFEQAMMYVYIAIQKAACGEWDNARAAAGSSLFLLKDFGEATKGRRKSTEEIARQAAEYDTSHQGGDYIGNGYVARESNFAYGYLMSGIANAVLGRDAEADDHYEAALATNGGLTDVVRRLQAQEYNTILVVDYGLGPEKIRYGMDDVFTRFVPRNGWTSGQEPLEVSIQGGPAERFAVACDLNNMAADHMWNNMEDVRVAKSVLGNALLATGVGITAFSSESEHQVAGLIIAGVGAAMKASAAADIRHCDLLPQRVYVVPVTVPLEDSTLVVRVGSSRVMEMVLPGVDPPQPPEKVRLHYVRMTPTYRPPAWGMSGMVVYANDEFGGAVDGDGLPYILGGRCVRMPSQEALQHYQRAGYLTDFTTADLENLYRDEGIKLGLDENGGRAGLHVLEGGNVLYCPSAGSAGFQRLFCQEHRAYKPKSDRVRALVQTVSAGAELRGAARVD